MNRRRTKIRLVVEEDCAGCRNLATDIARVPFLKRFVLFLPMRQGDELEWFSQQGFHTALESVGASDVSMTPSVIRKNGRAEVVHDVSELIFGFAK